MASPAPAQSTLQAIIAAGFTLDQLQQAVSALPRKDRKNSRKIDFTFNPIYKGSIGDTFQTYGCTATAGVVLVTMEETLNPESPDEFRTSRGYMATRLRCTEQGVDKAIDLALRPLRTVDGKDVDPPIEFRRVGREIGLKVRKESICRLGSVPPKPCKTIATVEEREAKKKAEEEKRQAEIEAAVEQRILAKAGELLCPRCGSEHTGLACFDCETVTPIVRDQVETAPDPKPPTPPPPQVAPKTTTPVDLSPNSKTVLSVLVKLLSAVFLTKLRKRLDPALCSKIVFGLGLKPQDPCTPEAASLIQEYVTQFEFVDWANKKNPGGLAGSKEFLEDVRQTWEQKRKLPPETEPPPGKTAEEEIEGWFDDDK